MKNHRNDRLLKTVSALIVIFLFFYPYYKENKDYRKDVNSTTAKESHNENDEYKPMQAFIDPMSISGVPIKIEALKIDEKFEYKKLNFSTEDYYVNDIKYGDVTGDGNIDEIVLVGRKEDDASSPFTDNMIVLVQDKARNVVTLFSPDNNAGYSADMFLGDFNSDGIKDIMIGLDTGANGGAGVSAYSIYSFGNSQFTSLFTNKDELNSGLCFELKFLDGYKVLIRNEELKREFVIDISNKKKEYEEDGYYVKGKLNKRIQGWADDYFMIVPKDVDDDGTLELIGYQYICGRDHADWVAYAKSTLKWDKEKQKWYIKKLTVQNMDDYELEEYISEKYQWDKEYYSSWIAIDKIYYMPISAMSKEEYRSKYFGRVVHYSKSSAAFNQERVSNPVYTERALTNEVFFEEFGVELKDLGISDASVKVVQIDNWINPTSCIIMKDDDTIISLWDGVFFELKRR